MRTLGLLALVALFGCGGGGQDCGCTRYPAITTFSDALGWHYFPAFETFPNGVGLALTDERGHTARAVWLADRMLAERDEARSHAARYGFAWIEQSSAQHLSIPANQPGAIASGTLVYDVERDDYFELDEWLSFVEP